MWTFTVPRPVPSSNARYVNGGSLVQMAIYRRHREAWARDLRVAALAAGMRDALVTDGYRPRRRIVIVRLMRKGQRRYDEQNLVAGCKAIVDAMQPPRPGAVTVFKSGRRQGQPRLVKPLGGAALIVSDAPGWVVVEYHQERGDAPGCRITIENITQEAP